MTESLCDFSKLPLISFGEPLLNCFVGGVVAEGGEWERGGGGVLPSQGAFKNVKNNSYRREKTTLCSELAVL